MYEVWTRDYSTFDSGSWECAYSGIQDPTLAEFVADHLGEGWGTDAEVRKAVESLTPTWASLSLAEFNEQYIFGKYSVAPVLRNTPEGQQLEEAERGHQEWLANWNAMKDLREIGRIN